MPAPFATPVAISIPFEPNRNPQWNGNAGPSGLESTDVQSAIEEAKADALANDRFLLLPNFGGNANTGRYLEIFPNQASDTSPIFSSAGLRILSVVLQTTAANTTCTVGIFDINVSTVVPVYSVVMVAQKRVEYIGSPLATLSANCQLAVRVTSGSINTPSMQIFFSTATS